MDFIELARSRYSCKKFDSRQISKVQLDSILEAGRLAPTAKNLQEQHVYVVQSAEGLAKVDALTPCRYGAPTMLIVAFDKNNVFTYPGQKYDSGIEDATINRQINWSLSDFWLRLGIVQASLTLLSACT